MVEDIGGYYVGASVVVHIADEVQNVGHMVVVGIVVVGSIDEG